MDERTIGKVQAIAVRTAPRGPMRETATVFARAGVGLEGDVPSSLRRNVTFLAAAQWAQAAEELAVNLPWHTRRANLLIDANSLGHLIGRNVRVGEVRVHVHAETTPCGLMDELHPGLRKALSPACRGGVYGEVLTDGAIRIGDVMVLDDCGG